MQVDGPSWFPQLAELLCDFPLVEYVKMTDWIKPVDRDVDLVILSCYDGSLIYWQEVIRPEDDSLITDSIVNGLMALRKWIGTK